MLVWSWCHIVVTFASTLSLNVGNCIEDMITLNLTFKHSSDLDRKRSAFW